MRFPRLKTCCCCFSLKTGAKVIGWTSLIYRAIEMQFYIHNMITISPDEDLGANMDKRIKVAYLRILQGVFLFMIIFQTIQCAFTVSFLVAVYRKNPKPLLHWLLKWFIVFLLEQIVSFLIFIYDDMTDDDLPAAIKYYCTSVFYLYYMWVVYSFYLDICDQPVEQHPPEITSSGMRDDAIQDHCHDNSQRQGSVENQSEMSIYIIDTSKPSTQQRDQEYTDGNM